jgi:hypothetical protein
MRFRRKFTAMATAGSAAALLLAGGSAAASAHAIHPATKTGREVASHSGMVSWARATKPNQKIPVRLRGVVNTTGTAQLGGYSKTHSFYTRVGRLVVKSKKLRIHAKVLNKSTCFLQVTVLDLDPLALGQQSTGVFMGSKGDGRAVVTFTFHFPKNSRGGCNYHGVPKRKGHVKFLCVFPALTVRQ